MPRTRSATWTSRSPAPRDFVTAIQLDTKLDGIPGLGARWCADPGARRAPDDPRRARRGHRRARRDVPRTPRRRHLREGAGRQDRRGHRPQGKMINQIQEETGADISIEDDDRTRASRRRRTARGRGRPARRSTRSPTRTCLPGDRRSAFVGTVVKTTSFAAPPSRSPRQGRSAAHQPDPQARGRQARRERRGRAFHRPTRVQVEIVKHSRCTPWSRTRLRPTLPRTRGRGRLTCRGTFRSSRRVTPGPSAPPGRTARRSVAPSCPAGAVPTESMPGLRSATVGAWVGVGSRDETDGHFGSMHSSSTCCSRARPAAPRWTSPRRSTPSAAS